MTNWIANKPGSIREDGGDIIYKGYIMAGQRYQWMGEVKKLKLETMFLTATIGGVPMWIQTWGDTQEFGGAGKREIYLSDDLNMLASKTGCNYHIYPSIQKMLN